MIIQLCGLSGSGKTTLSKNVREVLSGQGINVEIIDGDEYRKVLCADLGFSKEDRNRNIRRLAFVASKLSTGTPIFVTTPFPLGTVFAYNGTTPPVGSYCLFIQL